MDTIFSNIKERVLYIPEFKKISKEKFFANIGVTYGNFKGKAKEKALSSDILAKIVSNNPEFNSTWLLTGEGEMLKSNLDSTSATFNKKSIPLLPFDTFAGIGSDVEGVSFDAIDERYVVPLFDGTEIDFMLPVKGSSMYPKYSSGDVVACRLVAELLFVQWNKVYVIDTISQGVIMKRLKKSSDNNMLICKSDNEAYEPFEIPKSDIRNIALVVGVVRLE